MKYKLININKIKNSTFFSKIIPTLDSILIRELKDCQTVLDLGCGPSSPIKHIKKIKATGVEAFDTYLEESKKNKIHQKYIKSDILSVDFPDKSFDAVIMIDVIEHLNKKDGKTMIKKMEKWAKKKVIITTPNGFVSQPSVDDNQLQLHLSGWTPNEFISQGYKAFGLAGLKILRKNEIPIDDKSLYSSIKFFPKQFWFIIASISQIITYHIPDISFQNFYVKKNS